MAKYRVYRWLAYALALVLMVMREAAVGVRTGFDLWLAMVQQIEAGWKRRLAVAVA